MNIILDVKVINPEEIFAIDHLRWRIMHYDIGNSGNRIIVIKNFFKHPDKLKEYAESVDYVNTIHGQVSGIPGYIHRIGNGIKTLLRPIIGAATKNFDAGEDFVLNNHHKFTFQIYPISEKCRLASLHPHTDNVRYAGVCSLNNDEDYDGNDNGTALWRNDKTLEEYTSKDFNYRAKRVIGNNKDYVTLDPSKVDFPNWSIYHVIPHTYNTLIMYEGNLWHSPYFDLSKWKTNRITFNCFLD